LTVRFHIICLVLGENRAPPPLQYRQWVADLYWLFGSEPSIPQNAVTWTCDRLDWFSLIIIIIVFNISHLQASPGARVSSSFFLSVVFFSGGLPFALYSVWLRAVVQLALVSRCFMILALLFGPLPPIWLLQLLSQWSGSQIVRLSF
jgi:hypothetical protein